MMTNDNFVQEANDLNRLEKAAERGTVEMTSKDETNPNTALANALSFESLAEISKRLCTCCKKYTIIIEVNSTGGNSPLKKTIKDIRSPGGEALELDEKYISTHNCEIK